MNIALAGLSALALAACGKNSNLAGEWIQPVPGMPQITQGFVLGEDGSASSINMATLKYESWKEENGKLILTGKSIGNSQTIAFADTFEIEKLTGDSLTVRKGSLLLQYARRTADGKESIPAARLTPAKKTEKLGRQTDHSARNAQPHPRRRDLLLGYRQNGQTVRHVRLRDQRGEERRTRPRQTARRRCCETLGRLCQELRRRNRRTRHRKPCAAVARAHANKAHKQPAVPPGNRGNAHKHTAVPPGNRGNAHDKPCKQHTPAARTRIPASSAPNRANIPTNESHALRIPSAHPHLSAFSGRFSKGFPRGKKYVPCILKYV